MTRRTRIVLGGVATVVLGGAIAAAGVSAASSSSFDSQAVKPTAAPVAASFDLAALTEGKSAAASLPESLALSDFGTAGVQADTVRLISADEDASYFVGLGYANEICFIAALPGDVAGGGCESPEQFAARALGVRVAGPENITEAYLVPDSVATAGLPSVITVDPLDARKASRIATPSGYDLGLLPPVTKEELPPALQDSLIE